MERVSLKAVFREKELWILVLLGILYFYRPLFLGETFFFRDLGLYFLPQKQLLTDFIKVGELPLWDPYLHGGQPYLADISNSVFYPLNLLFVFLPLLDAFNLNIVLHLILCPVFTYLFSRVIGLQPISSLIVGVTYGFCGYTLSLANLLAGFLAMPYLPLSFLFWHLYLLEGNRKWFIMSVIVGSVRVFAGAPEINIISLLSLLGWTLFYPYPHTSMFRRFFLWSLLGMFIVGITLVQLFPTVEMVFHSSRGYGLDYAAFSQWSLHPGRLLEIFFPGSLGHLNNLLWNVYYWGGSLIDGRTPYIRSIYFGCIVIVFAFIGGLHKGNKRILPFRIRIFLLSLFIISLVLSMGRFLPFFPLLYQYIPLITLFRYPIKILIAGIFPLALLTGYAAEIHFGEKEDSSKNLKLLVVLWSITIILLTFTTIFLLSRNFANHFQNLFFKQVGGDLVHRGLRISFTHALGIWLLLTLLYQYRRLKRRRWQYWILAGIFIIDLFVAGKQINHYAPREFFTEIPSVVPIVRHEIGDGRLYRTEDPSRFTLQVSSYDVMWMYRSDFETLSSYRGAFYRFPVIFHGDFDGLAQVRLMKLKTLIDTLPWECRLSLLSAAGVTVILTSEHISLPGIHLIAEVPNRSNVPFYLYQNENAAARVEFVTIWEHVASDNEVVKVMLSPGYDPRKQVVLQEPESMFFELLSRIPKVRAVDSNFSERNDFHQIKKIPSNTHSAIFSVSNSCDGYLVFSEPFYPGWRVYIDGNPAPILRANYAFSAVFLKAGEHKVERYYRPNSLLYGVLSSIVFCGVLCLITYKGWLLIK